MLTPLFGGALHEVQVALQLRAFKMHPCMTTRFCSRTGYVLSHHISLSFLSNVHLTPCRGVNYPVGRESWLTTAPLSDCVPSTLTAMIRTRRNNFQLSRSLKVWCGLPGTPVSISNMPLAMAPSGWLTLQRDQNSVRPAGSTFMICYQVF